jgi:predicted AlkP superfamily pyrophosphatase or phosphodiesterase
VTAGARRPLVLIVLDGVRRDTANRSLSSLDRQVAASRGVSLPMTSFPPTSSRPSYATIGTGLPPSVHGISHNSDVRALAQPSIWSIARAHGLTTAASSFSWWSELFNGVPFDRHRDAYTVDQARPIQYGFFTPRDSEADVVVLGEARRLWFEHHPDLMLIHTLSVDYSGDFWGARSLAYKESARVVDLLLAPLLDDLWNDRPETIVLVTADHGMSDEGGHGWDAPELRAVFLLALGERLRPIPGPGATSLDIAPTVLGLLDLPVAEGMTGRRLVASTVS